MDCDQNRVFTEQKRKIEINISSGRDIKEFVIVSISKKVVLL
jgi:hypothetical protein